MTSLKTSIKTITYLSDIGCLEIQGASLWDGYVTYHINSDFTFAWQTTLYSKQNDYRYANHKKWATENAFVLQYHMTPDITPYIEYDYLDRQGVYNGRDNLSENSYRIGVSFKL